MPRNLFFLLLCCCGANVACEQSSPDDNADVDAGLDAGDNSDGAVADDGRALDGLPPDAGTAEVEMATLSDFIGNWAGVISVPGGLEFHIVARIKDDGEGAPFVTLDSRDQGAFDIPGEDPFIEGPRLYVLFPLLGASMVVAREGRTLVGAFTQGASLPITLRPTIIPPLRRPQEQMLARDYPIEEVTFAGGADGVTLAGELTLPEGADPAPGVVLVALSEASDRDMTLFSHKPMLVLAERLTHAGIATLRYDNRGTGDSGGDAATATTEDHAADAAAALAFLREQPGVEAAKTGLVGHTDGGLAAVLAGGQPALMVLLGTPSQPAVEVLMRRSRDLETLAGAPEEVLDSQAMFQEMLFDAVRNAATVEEAQAMVVNLLVNAGVGFDRASQQAEELTRPWLRWILDYDPMPALRAIECPVLALYGDKGLIVAADANAPDMEAALGHADSSVQVLPGLNHFFQPATFGGPGEYADIDITFDPDAMDLIANWITEVMTSAQGQP